ncbi:MAG: hypothetical protein U5N86_10040 [Planctomycetota bacterium]|nr:hypothetical protein [Planctomycetota bacterium]
MKLMFDSGGKWFHELGYSKLFTPQLTYDYEDTSLTVYRRGRDLTSAVTLGYDDDGTYFYFSIVPRFYSPLSTNLKEGKFD